MSRPQDGYPSAPNPWDGADRPAPTGAAGAVRSPSGPPADPARDPELERWLAALNPDDPGLGLDTPPPPGPAWHPAPADPGGPSPIPGAGPPAANGNGHGNGFGNGRRWAADWDDLVEVPVPLPWQPAPRRRPRPDPWAPPWPATPPPVPEPPDPGAAQVAPPLPHRPATPGTPGTAGAGPARLVPGRASRHKAKARPAGRAKAVAGRAAFLRELPFLLIVAVLLAVIVKGLVVQAFYIPSSSMEPTLQVGDRVLVNRLAYRQGTPGHGQVIVFYRPDPDAGPQPTGVAGFVKRAVAQGLGYAPPGTEDLIKRVIGEPGDVLFARNGKVWRNGRPLDEPYVKPGARTSAFGPIRVPDDHVWVMGDNREDSADSRKFGLVPTETLVGRAVVLIWPFGNVSRL
jgi:signal peptidase I